MIENALLTFHVLIKTNISFVLLFIWFRFFFSLSMWLKSDHSVWVSFQALMFKKCIIFHRKCVDMLACERRKISDHFPKGLPFVRMMQFIVLLTPEQSGIDSKDSHSVCESFFFVNWYLTEDLVRRTSTM